jgi:hypothetical protein
VGLQPHEERAIPFRQTRHPGTLSVDSISHRPGKNFHHYPDPPRLNFNNSVTFAKQTRRPRVARLGTLAAAQLEAETKTGGT